MSNQEQPFKRSDVLFGGVMITKKTTSEAQDSSVLLKDSAIMPRLFRDYIPGQVFHPSEHRLPVCWGR